MIFSNIIYRRNIGYGISMEPLIETGDVLLIQNFPNLNQNLEGKVVSYETKLSHVTHRVLKDEGEIVYFQGDNSPYVDSPVFREEITGIVAFIMPSWFWIADFGILIGALASLVIMLCWMVKNET